MNPYSAPDSSLRSDSEIRLSGPYGRFRNNGPLKIIIITFLVIEAMVVLFNGILNHMLPANVVYEPDGPLVKVYLISHMTQVSLRIILAVIISIWINRICKNAWLLDPPKMSITPALAVGYYFIPILFLWKPYVSMREIRNASYGREDAMPLLLPLWWSSCIFFFVLATSIHLIFEVATDQETLRIAQRLSLIIIPVTILRNYITIALVVRITNAQIFRAAHWKA
ncbi:DUF4328 domain-containing protein [Verrucomicrobiaceae bacterium N1E253]|uniref:DUF4328 domain-containing protein n=1 Tax=Oceaniferula marina TaxID=2748318 RepID=A0A851GI79_9BACT|nr:DUF4328 domain-containing protein [Oceaniferula marina]NWK56899.1 DUF4328 domain-containing protein [Oceaniferula marina]